MVKEQIIDRFKNSVITAQGLEADEKFDAKDDDQQAETRWNQKQTAFNSSGISILCINTKEKK